MNDNDQTHFNQIYKRHINELTLQGKSERTIEMYSRTLRKITAQFDLCPERLLLKI